MRTAKRRQRGVSREQMGWVRFSFVARPTAWARPPSSPHALALGPGAARTLKACSWPRLSPSPVGGLAGEQLEARAHSQPDPLLSLSKDTHRRPRPDSQGAPAAGGKGGTASAGRRHARRGAGRGAGGGRGGYHHRWAAGRENKTESEHEEASRAALPKPSLRLRLHSPPAHTHTLPAACLASGTQFTRARVRPPPHPGRWKRNASARGSQDRLPLHARPLERRRGGAPRPPAWRRPLRPRPHLGDGPDPG